MEDSPFRRRLTKHQDPGSGMSHLVETKSGGKSKKLLKQKLLGSYPSLVEKQKPSTQPMV
jgi:hypothetical protein